MENINSLSKLVITTVIEDYETTNKILNDKSFNPNELCGCLHQPSLSAILFAIQNLQTIREPKRFKLVLETIAKHKDFDPNIQDLDGNTPLMHAAKYKTYNWLSKIIADNEKTDLKIVNNANKTAVDVALAYKNYDFLISVGAKKCIDNGLLVQAKKNMAKKKKNYNILKVIDESYIFKTTNKPIDELAYNLLTSFFNGKYKECENIIEDKNFNPNACDLHKEPIVTSFIYYSQDYAAEYDYKELQKLLIKIINLPSFDINATDVDNNTILMTSMSFPKMEWLTNELFKSDKIDFDCINTYGYGIEDAAIMFSYEDLYKEALNKNK